MWIPSLIWILSWKIHLCKSKNFESLSSEESWAWSSKCMWLNVGVHTRVFVCYYAWISSKRTYGWMLDKQKVCRVLVFSEHLGKQMDMTHKAWCSHAECISPEAKLKTNSVFIDRPNTSQKISHTLKRTYTLAKSLTGLIHPCGQVRPNASTGEKQTRVRICAHIHTILQHCIHKTMFLLTTQNHSPAAPPPLVSFLPFTLFISNFARKKILAQ